MDLVVQAHVTVFIRLSPNSQRPNITHHTLRARLTRISIKIVNPPFIIGGQQSDVIKQIPNVFQHTSQSNPPVKRTIYLTEDPMLTVNIISIAYCHPSTASQNCWGSILFRDAELNNLISFHTTLEELYDSLARDKCYVIHISIQYLTITHLIEQHVRTTKVRCFNSEKITLQ